MRKKLLSVLVTLAMVLSLLPVTAWAEEPTEPELGTDRANAVKNAEDLAAVLNNGAGTPSPATVSDNTVALSGDVTHTGTIYIGASNEEEIILDLKGHTLTIETIDDTKNAGIVIEENVTLTINDTGTTGTTGTIKLEYTPRAGVTGKNPGAIQVSARGELIVENGNIVSNNSGITLFDVGSSVTVNGGTITGEKFGISTEGSQSRTGSSVEITGGSVISRTTAAIYHPSSGALTISDGTISGLFGIVARAGEITISGGTIEAVAVTNPDYVVGNAKDDKGPIELTPAGIIFDSAGYPGEDRASVNISGGTVSAPTGVPSVNFTVKGGNPTEGFINPITIEGGTFLTGGKRDNSIKDYLDGKAVDASGNVVGSDFRDRVVPVADKNNDSGVIESAELGDDGIVEVVVKVDTIDSSVSGSGTGDTDVEAYWVGIGIIAPGAGYTLKFGKGESAEPNTPNNGNGSLDSFNDGKKGFTIWLNAGSEGFIGDEDGGGITYTLKWTKLGEDGKTVEDERIEVYHITLLFDEDVTPPTIITSDVYAAPQGGDYATDYTITKTSAADGHTAITLTAKNVTKHPNGAVPPKDGFWVGVSFVPTVPEGSSLPAITNVRYKTASTQAGLDDEPYKEPPLEQDVDGKGASGIAIYVDAANYSNGESLWIAINWPGSVEIYEVIFDVTLKLTRLAVTFDANGGTFADNKTEETVLTGADGVVPESEWPEDPERKGYEFVGWFTTKETEDEDGEEIKEEAITAKDHHVFTETTTLYAHWAEVVYLTASPDELIVGVPVQQITLTVNGGGVKFVAGEDVEDEDEEQVEDEDEDEEEVEDEEEGETGGEAEDEEVEQVEDEDEEQLEGEEEGEDEGEDEDEDEGEGENKGALKREYFSLSDNALTITGVKRGSSENKVTITLKGSPSKAGTLTITVKADAFANWEEALSAEIQVKRLTYTVTFDPNGGTVEPTSQQTNESGILPYMPTPTRDGYTFDGWFTAKEGGDKATTATVFKDDTTLFAHWTKKPDDPGSDDPGTDDPGPDDPGPDDPGEEKSSYAIRIPSFRHGTISTTHTSAEPGTWVTLTVRAETDYEVDLVRISRDDGSRIWPSQSGRRYSFTMPASDVTVDASFSLMAVYNNFIPPQTRPQTQTSAQTSLPASAFAPLARRPAVTMWDVPANSWAYPAAQWAYQNGYLDLAADRTFRLNDTVSHIQMWKIMAWWQGESALDDYSVTLWARKTGAARVGTASGAMTRQNIVEYLYQCYFLMGGDVSVTGNLIQYSDSQLVTSASAKNAWLWAVNKGIISGTPDGSLNPNGILSRGEFASILMRLYQSR